MRPGVAVVVVLLVASSAGRAQLQARLGARGEIAELGVQGAGFLTDGGVSLVKPGWDAVYADQRTVAPGRVRVERADAATTYTMTLAAGGANVRFRQVVRTSQQRMSVACELTPDRDLRVETVALQASLPETPHAGSTRYVVGDSSAARGVLPAALGAQSYLIVGGRLAEWVAFVRPSGQALRIVPQGLTLQVQDNRRWSFASFGLLLSTEGGTLAAGRTIRFGVTYEATTAAAVDAAARALARNDLAGLRMTDHRPLRIHGVTADRRTTVACEPVELTVDVAASYENPFDPAQIAVDAEVTRPDRSTVLVPGFYDAPMRLETRVGVERVRLAGRPTFRVRYTPPSPGAYRIVLRATDRSGTVRSAPVRITASRGTWPGFIRVARGSAGYFRYDDGRPYFAVGENMCWSGPRTPLADYSAWLKGLGAAGGNWARLWLANNEKGLEWMPAPTPKAGPGNYLGLGRYALDNAWRLDRIVRLARQNGVSLMFCLGTYGEFTEGGYFDEGMWVSNPYNARNGGPCARPADFWTDPTARRLYKQRLRYLIARWGYAPNLFAWEFWNEVPAGPERDAWVAEMAAYLKRHDPNRHLVSTTYGDARTWRCPDVDFSMTHMYGQAGNIADFTPRIVADARDGRKAGKPYLLAEFGIDWQTGDGKWDPKGTGLSMHNGAWAAMMAGAAGTAMLWYWDGYVHPNNLYRVLTPVRKFADTVDWARARLTTVAGITLEAAPGEPETFSDVTVPAMVEWGATPSSEYTVRRDGTVQGGPVAMSIGSPKRADPNELHTRLTWHLDLPRPARVALRLGRVASRAHMVISVDGEVKVDRELTTGEPGKGPWKSSVYLEQYGIWTSDYDEAIPLDLPAGKHTVAIANTDGDWFQIRSITLPGYRSSRYPDVNALGLREERLLLLWIHNRASTWRTAYEGRQPRALRGLRMSVPAPGRGAWRVAWWDTFRGSVVRRDTVSVRQGRLLLKPPDLARDLAARCERIGR